MHAEYKLWSRCKDLPAAFWGKLNGRPWGGGGGRRQGGVKDSKEEANRGQDCCACRSIEAGVKGRCMDNLTGLEKGAACACKQDAHKHPVTSLGQPSDLHSLDRCLD